MQRSEVPAARRCAARANCSTHCSRDPAHAKRRGCTRGAHAAQRGAATAAHAHACTEQSLRAPKWQCSSRALGRRSTAHPLHSAPRGGHAGSADTHKHRVAVCRNQPIDHARQHTLQSKPRRWPLQGGTSAAASAAAAQAAASRCSRWRTPQQHRRRPRTAAADVPGRRALVIPHTRPCASSSVRHGIRAAAATCA